MTSAVLIAPTALRLPANAIGEAMGWGPYSYTIPLSADWATVTHYGCRADVSPEFVALITAAQAGELPPGLPPEAAGIIAALIIDLSEELSDEAPLLAVLADHAMIRVGG
jgi:hypothetical protein